MQTFGELFDQFVTVVIKTYDCQEMFQSGEFEDLSEEELKAYIRRSRGLNVQRNQLIDEINAKLARIMSGEEEIIEFKKYKTRE